jgi:O-acetyl-ADP-ribose deacetylase (regulator of RNase III)
MSGRVELVRGDITRLAVDAIVNAANSTLLGGGGVDGAIHRAAGPELLWRNGGAGEDATLASCYRTALGLVAERRLASVAFPAISCGVYGFPVARACRIAVDTIRAHLAGAAHPERVCLVAFDADVHAAYTALLRDP